MIRFAPEADRDLQHIDNWISADNGAVVAARITESILTSIRYLDRFPELGRPGRRKKTRELGVPSTPYTIVYKLVGKDVMIARIMHGAQQRIPPR